MPPWKVMPSGNFASAAIGHEASTPVPSSTTATALSSTARRAFATADCGDSWLSTRLIFRT
jgi:hypothetical protein